MSWNYRIFKHLSRWKDKRGKTRRTTSYALHEAYYDKRGKMDGWTADAVSPHADSPKELITVLEMQLKDAKKSRKDVVKFK